MTKQEWALAAAWATLNHEAGKSQTQNEDPFFWERQRINKPPTDQLRHRWAKEAECEIVDEKALTFTNPVTGSTIKGEAPGPDLARGARLNAISICCPLCDEWLYGDDEIKAHKCLG